MSAEGLLAAFDAQSAELSALRTQVADLTEQRDAARVEAADAEMAHSVYGLGKCKAMAECVRLRAALDKIVAYCNEADNEASVGKIGHIVQPWAGHIRYLAAVNRAAVEPMPCAECGLSENYALHIAGSSEKYAHAYRRPTQPATGEKP